METSQKSLVQAINQAKNNSITLKEYELGLGVHFRRLLFPIIFLNGVIYATRYGLGTNKRLGAFVLLGSYPLASYIAFKFFGDQKLADLGLNVLRR
jgi:hypothetical protein